MSAKTFSLFDPKLTREDLQSADFADALAQSFAVETAKAAVEAVAAGFKPNEAAAVVDRERGQAVTVKVGYFRKSRTVVTGGSAPDSPFIGILRIGEKRKAVRSPDPTDQAARQALGLHSKARSE